MILIKININININIKINVNMNVNVNKQKKIFKNVKIIIVLQFLINIIRIKKSNKEVLKQVK